MTVRILIALLGLAVMLGACKDTFPPQPDPGNGTKGKWKNITWHLKSYRTADGVLHTIPSNVEATARFSDTGSVGGNTSCNMYGGEYAADDSTIAIRNLYQTERYCFEVAEIEKAFMEGMQNAGTYKVTDESLHLYGKRGDVIELNFGSDCPPPPGNDVGGIVYNAYEGSSEVFGVMRLSKTGSATRIGDGYIASAPIGGRIAWANGGPSIVMKWQAMLGNADGSGQTAIYPRVEDGWMVHPGTVALSPTGNGLAYGAENTAVVPPLATVELRVARTPADTGHPVPGPMPIGAAPAFSPDGRQVAYYTVGGELKVVDIDDLENPRALATNAATTFNDHGRIAWSRDGSMIVYVGRDGTGASTDLFIIDAQGANAPKALTNDADRELWPVFSPDGTTIAFSAGTPFPDRLFTIDADGSGGRKPVLNRATTVVLYDLFPAWSPDGSGLLFTSYTALPNVDAFGSLEKLDLATQTTTRLVDKAGPGFYER